MFFGLLFASLYLFLPGYTILRLLHVRHWSILTVGLAPVVSAAYYGILGPLYALLGVSASPISMIAPVLLGVLCLICIDVSLKVCCGRFSKAAVINIFIYAAMGLFITRLVFICSLPSADGIVEQYDIIFHVNLIRKFLETGVFSCFGISVGSLDSSFYGFKPAGFYPAAWHEIVTLVAMSTGYSVLAAINATNWAICGLVLPLGTLYLFSQIFEWDWKTIAIGSVAPLAFISFPWRLLLWGPIFPNLAALCCAPSVMALLMALLGPAAEGFSRARLVVPCLLGFVGLAVLQPNAVFAVGVFAAFYLINTIALRDGLIYDIFPVRVSTTIGNHRLLATCLWCLVSLLLWVAFYKSPYLHGVVSYVWPAFATFPQGIVNVVEQAFMFGNGYPTYSQLLLALIIILGVASALMKRNTRWLVAPYLFFCISFIVNVSSDGFAKRFLTGFWYSDPNRVAACAAIMALPLAAIGLSIIANWVQCLLTRHSDASDRLRDIVPIPVVAVLFLSINYFPNFLDPSTNNAVNTPFGTIESQYAESYQKSIAYTSSEEDFVKEVENVLPSDALIINNPRDGSVAAFGFDGLGVVFNQIESAYQAHDGTDSYESKMLRSSLCDVASDVRVQNLVSEIGAQYVLKLYDQDGDTSITKPFAPDEWSGISDVTDHTPGFEVVLAEGEMRLYRITY